MEKERPATEMLAERLKEHSARLNAARVLPTPVASSRVPVIAPLVALLRRLANRLATRWYVAPQMEQQARFAQEVTAAYDQLAAALVLLEQMLAEHGRRLDESERAAARLATPALFSSPDSAAPQPACARNRLPWSGAWVSNAAPTLL